jgi:periplasmic protein TonB
MSNLLDDGNDLEQELTGESLGKPATGSVLLHVGLAAFVVAWGLISGFFHSTNWGDQSNGGAISVNITASIPIPSTQPPNDNVLATDHPSPAPAPPAPKTETHVDEKAIPILGKPVKQQEKPEHKTPPVKQEQKPVNRAQYGEQAANNLPRAITARNNPGPTSIQQGNFGSLYGWYVNQINNKMAQTWNKFEVNPATPKGSRVFLTFTINRDGSPSNVRLDRSSGSPTLDRSCINAVNRVDSFGPLPNGYNAGSLNVSYYCEY